MATEPQTLTWRELLTTVSKMHTLSMRIIFYRKVFFMALGIVAYYAILYAFATFRPGEGFSVEQALTVLVEIPGTVLAIYLTMDMVAGERDKDTLEILFSTAISHYTTWSVRIISICGLMFITLMVMSTISYYFFAEFPYIYGGANAFLPAFFMVGVTFLFSVLCRSSNAAGMLSVGTLLLILFFSESGLKNTSYDLFLKPFENPTDLEANFWTDSVFLNRLGVMVLGGLFIFLALRRMEERERLL